MSVEMIDPDESGEVIALFGVEAMKLRRRLLQQRLAEASIVLVNAAKDQNNCIREIIELDIELAEKGVDTQALARELQREVPHGSAINDYGHYE